MIAEGPGRQKTCPRCGSIFVQSRKWQRFCSVDCRDIWHAERIAILRPLIELPLNDEQLRFMVVELTNHVFAKFAEGLKR